MVVVQKVVSVKSLVEDALEGGSMLEFYRLIIFLLVIWYSLRRSTDSTAYEFRTSVENQLQQITTAPNNLLTRADLGAWMYNFTNAIIANNFWLLDYSRVDWIFFNWKRLPLGDRNNCIFESTAPCPLYNNPRLYFYDHFGKDEPYGPPDDPQRYVAVRTNSNIPDIYTNRYAFFRLLFPNNLTESQRVLDQLQADGVLSSWENTKFACGVMARDIIHGSRYIVKFEFTPASMYTAIPLSAGLTVPNIDYRQNYAEIVADAFALFLALTDVFVIVREWRKVAKQKNSWYACLRMTWTWVEVLSILGFLMEVISRILVEVYPNSSVNSADPPDVQYTAFVDLLVLSVFFIVQQYAGYMYLMLVAIRMFKCVRFFAGMRVYTQIISNAWTHLKDYLVFFGSIVLLLSVFLNGVFGNSGGNVRFIYIASAFRDMMRMSVGFYDFDVLVNGYIGVDFFGFLIDLTFFVLVIMLVLLGQNVMLAIVVNAYDESKQRNNMKQGSQKSFVVTMLHSSITYTVSLAKIHLQRTNLKESEIKLRFLTSRFMGEIINLLVDPALGGCNFPFVQWIEPYTAGADGIEPAVNQFESIMELFPEETSDPQLDLLLFLEWRKHQLYLERVRRNPSKAKKSHVPLWDLDQGDVEVLSSTSNQIHPENDKLSSLEKTADRERATALAQKIIDMFGTREVRAAEHEQVTDKERLVKLQNAVSDLNDIVLGLERKLDAALQPRSASTLKA